MEAMGVLKKSLMGKEEKTEAINSVFRLKIKINDKEIQQDVSTDVEINYDLLEEQLTETPSKFAFWSMILADQKFKLQTIEKRITRRKSKLLTDYFDQAQQNGYKVTKYMADEFVEADDELLRLESLHIIELRLYNKLWGVVDSLKMKSEHLRSLAGFKKQEMRDA